MKQILFPLFFQIQALGPVLGARSREILQNTPMESSVRFNLTDLVTKEGSIFASTHNLFYHTPLCTTSIAFTDITTGKIGNACLPSFYTKSSYPILPVVLFRDIVREQGQKASRQINNI